MGSNDLFIQIDGTQSIETIKRQLINGGDHAAVESELFLESTLFAHPQGGRNLERAPFTTAELQVPDTVERHGAAAGQTVLHQVRKAVILLSCAGLDGQNRQQRENGENCECFNWSHKGLML